MASVTGVPGKGPPGVAKKLDAPSRTGDGVCSMCWLAGRSGDGSRRSGVLGTPAPKLGLYTQDDKCSCGRDRVVRHIGKAHVKVPLPSPPMPMAGQPSAESSDLISCSNDRDASESAPGYATCRTTTSIAGACGEWHTFCS